MAEQTVVPPSVETKRSLWHVDPAWLGRLALVGVGVLVLARVFQHRLGIPHASMLIDWVVYFALFAGLLSFVPIRTWLLAIPSPHRWVLGGFIACIMVGQLGVENRRTFPFPAWMMYGRPTKDRLVVYYRYRGLDASGKEVWINPVRVFPFVNSAEIASRIRFAAAKLESSDSAKREIAAGKMHDWIVALGTAYNDDHKDAPVRSLTFVRYRWDFREGPPPAPVAGESVLSVDFADRSAR